MRKFQFVLAAVLVVATSGLVSYAVSASVPSSLLTAGTTRYAVAQSPYTALTSSSTWSTVPSMATTLSIPSGKVGDVMMVFCGDASAISPTTLQVRGVIKGNVAYPGYIVLKGDQVIANSCATFYRTSVGAGTVSIAIQFRSSDGAHVAYLFQRSMIVTVNIH